MRISLLAITLLTATPAFAEDAAPLNYDIAKLCDWQKQNNSMDVGECTKLEEEAKAAVAELEGKADSKRRDGCTTETRNYSGDSGFASYTVYAGCLKDGPGSF